jgi:hypothetical protein
MDSLLVAKRLTSEQSGRMSASRATRVLMLVVAVIAAACSSSHSATRLAPSTSSGRSPRTTFCDLYRQDASNGRLRNWNLNGNAKTPSYTATLRAFADAAPPNLKSDIAPILSYYAAPHRQLSPAEGLAALRSGECVLAYVHDTCGIDTTASPPPGDTATTRH